MVVIWHRVSENGSIISQRVIERLPDPLHGLVSHANFPILIVNTGKEPCIEAHLSKEAWVSTGMTKGINVPANDRAGIITELTCEPFMADEHIVHHVVVVRAGLVMHGPAGIDELKTTLFDKLACLFLAMLVLVVPPQREELDLDLSETFLLVSNQLFDISVDDVLNTCFLDILL